MHKQPLKTRRRWLMPLRLQFERQAMLSTTHWQRRMLPTKRNRQRKLRWLSLK
jgi:hypothetical protein